MKSTRRLNLSRMEITQHFRQSTQRTNGRAWLHWCRNGHNTSNVFCDYNLYKRWENIKPNPLAHCLITGSQQTWFCTCKKIRWSAPSAPKRSSDLTESFTSLSFSPGKLLHTHKQHHGQLALHLAANMSTMRRLRHDEWYQPIYFMQIFASFLPDFGSGYYEFIRIGEKSGWDR